MVDIKELRIGNWLLGCNLNYFQVDTDTFAALEHKQIEGYADCPTAIPLTPEILEKCGFYPYGESNNFAFQYGHQVGMEKYISINSDNFSIEIEHYWNGDSSAIYLQDIKYLHQLQNLHWILVGQELQISL